MVDPLSEKYYSMSPYNYVANNPIIFIDPDGTYIDWGDLSGKEKRTIKRAMKKHNSSGTYKNLHKQLKKSDNRYLVKTENTNSTTGAKFEGNSTWESMEGDKHSTNDDFGADEKGGSITFNLGIVDGLKSKDQSSILGDFAVEEVVHAAQYDDQNQEDNSAGLAGTANTEFEAKAIVGQVQHESKKDLWTSQADKSANSYGVQAFKSGSTNGYKNALNNWHKNLPAGSNYKKKRVTNAKPKLLQRLISR